MHTKNYLLIFSVILFSFATAQGFAGEPLSPVWALQFSPDGKMLAVGKYQWVELWDLETQAVIHTYEPHAGEVRCLKFSPVGAMSESRSNPSRMRGSGLQTPPTAGPPATLPNTSSSTSYPAGGVGQNQAPPLMLYASGGVVAQSGEIHIWDVASAERIKTLDIHGDAIESIAISPDNTTLLTASMDEYSAVINLAQYDDTIPIDEQAKWLTQHVGRVLCTLYHPDGTYFVTGSEDKTIKVWHPEDYTVLVNFDGNDDAVYSLAYAAQNNLIVSGAADSVIRSWRVTQNEEGETRGALVRQYTAHEGAVYSVDCGVWNNQEIIASGGADTSVIIWNLRSGNPRSTFNEPTDAVYAVQLSPNGEFVAAGGRDGKVRLWNLRTGTLIHELTE